MQWNKVCHTCLQVALQQGTISLSVATELFKTARLTKAESSKDATLANDPCTENEDDYTFSVANYNDSVTTSARERYLGLTNRVIAGMLLQTTRTTPVNCTDSRFSDIESLCKGGQTQICTSLSAVHHGHCHTNESCHCSNMLICMQAARRQAVAAPPAGRMELQHIVLETASQYQWFFCRA